MSLHDRARRVALREHGQSMVELTLVLPVLLLIVFAIAQLGITFNRYVTLTDAVRAGARTGAVSRLSPTPTSDTVASVRAAASGLSAASLGVSVASTWVHGADVTVTGTYPYSINLFGLVVASGNLSSSTTERVE